MSEYRVNTLVVDFSVLPSRPSTSDVESFLLKTIKLKMTDVKILQFHNTRHCVFIETVDKETAYSYQREHNRKHAMVIDGKKFAIPVYVEDGAVCVRIHDLPTSMPASVVSTYMQQYGTIHSMGWERWKHYFPGTINGVRVLRMHLTRPIPSYITIENELTLVSYDSQHKTCRFCNMAIHPKQKCREVSNKESSAAESINLTEFPAITEISTPTIIKNQSTESTSSQLQQQKKLPGGEQHQSNNNTGDDQAETDDDVSSGSTAFVDPNRDHNNHKRRLTTSNKKEMKTPSQTSSAMEQSGDSEMEESSRSFASGPLRRSKRNK